MQALKEYVFPHLAFQLLPYTWDTRKKIPNFALLKIGSIPGGWFGVCHKFDSGMHKQWVYYRLHFGFRETYLAAALSATITLRGFGDNYANPVGSRATAN